jgi:hypothetical protein
MNTFIGFVILVWIITPIAYYSNWWNAKTFPIASYQIYTKEGYIYNVSQVLDSQLQLNETAYKSYGKVYLTNPNRLLLLIYRRNTIIVFICSSLWS